MRTELAPDAASPGAAPARATAASPGPPSTRRSPPARRRRVLGLDGFELGLLAAFSLFSLWVVALDLRQVVFNGRVWTGTDGFFVVDQMQYLAWIQSAAHHLLISNLFVLRSSPADYLQPAMVVSGAIVALGVAPWLSLLLWKPVAVLAIFLASRAHVRRTISDRLGRRCALVLALAFGSFSVVYGAFGIVGDMMPTWLTWGYPFGLLAVALIVFAMLSYDRARAECRVAWSPGLLGALASLLHPWQGEVLAVTILAAEVVRWREHRDAGERSALRLALLTLALTGAPLAYYLALGHLDLSWILAQQASKHTFSFWSIALGAAPLALFAALGYRGRPRNFLDLVTRLWPAAALAIYLFSATTLSATPLHAFDGITLPLAVLAVRGVRQSRLRSVPRARLAGIVAIAAGVIPANAYAMASANQFVAPTPGNANFITKDEQAALDYLRHDSEPGGVLTPFYLGEVVPARTDRHTFVGDCLWSEPNCLPNSTEAQDLFTGRLSAAQARSFVLSTGARFLLSSCAPGHVDLTAELRPMLASVRRFGCATVYELDASGR